MIVLFFVAALLGGPGLGHAQELFPRFAFHLDGQYLTTSDDRFNWVFTFGGDLDVFDWGRGRATFRAHYEAIAGEEFRRFDVNQGNYLLEGVIATRVRGAEIAAVWHHVSRHLSDRPKRFPIDWNQITGRVTTRWTDGAAAMTWQTDIRATVTKAYVDYDWEVESAASIRRPLTARYGTTASGSVRLVGVDGSRGRGTQAGGRAEAGVSVNGGVAAAELFVAIERRIDPYPLEFGTSRWFLAGLRLTSVP